MDSLPIHPYDVCMLIVLVGATAFGAWKGMAWQLASLASVAVSTVVAIHFSGPLAPYFSVQEPWNRFLAMLVLYLGTSLGIWLVFRLVSGLIDRVRLKEFDRQLGAAFGLTKGVLLCVVITFFAVTLSEVVRQSVLKSKSGFYIARLTQHAGPILPEEVRAVVGKYLDELDKKLTPDKEQPQQLMGTGLNLDPAWGKSADSTRGLNDRLDAAARAMDDAASRLGSTTSDASTGLKRGVDDLSRGAERGRGVLDRMGSEFDAWKSNLQTKPSR